MGKTTIEWTDRSVNPIRARDLATARHGHFCEKVSAGCTHCYSSAMQRRFGMHEFVAKNREKIEFWLDERQLSEVLNRKRPTKWFWCDMTDMFGDWVPDEWLDKCFLVMALTPHHTHQILTKRPERMCRYLTYAQQIRRHLRWSWPLPSVWLGVSAEDQTSFEDRWTWLRQTPAAIRFLSLEPMLGHIDISSAKTSHQYCDEGTDDDPTPIHRCWPSPNLVIVGGESGPHARPFDIQWARNIRDQCEDAGAAFFYKQGGTYNRCEHSAKGGHLDCFPADLQIREFPDERK